MKKEELTNIFTNRELEVLQYLIKGYTNKEISEELIISEHTAKAHVCSILHKLNAKNRAIACYLAGKYIEI